MMWQSWADWAQNSWRLLCVLTRGSDVSHQAMWGVHWDVSQFFLTCSTAPFCSLPAAHSASSQTCTGPRDTPCAPTACSTWNSTTLNTQRQGCCFYSIFWFFLLPFLCNCKLMSSGIFVTDLYKYTARGKGAGALYTLFLIIVKRTA